MLTRMIRVAALFIIFSAVPFSATAQDIVAGRTSVAGGDSLEIHGQRIRLHGIDAPESGQWCSRNQIAYRCGQEAAFALADKIGFKVVNCLRRDTDRYKRVVRCARPAAKTLAAGWWRGATRSPIAATASNTSPPKSERGTTSAGYGRVNSRSRKISTIGAGADRGPSVHAAPASVQVIWTPPGGVVEGVAPSRARAMSVRCAQVECNGLGRAVIHFYRFI